MRIQGKSCTLTVAKDGYYYPLPYSEETVREASKGYALPGVIGERNREKTIITGKTILGCFVTRLEYQNVLALFLLLFYYEEVFDLLADRICEQLIYKNLTVKSFELRGENKKPLYLRIDVKDTTDSLGNLVYYPIQHRFPYPVKKTPSDGSVFYLLYLHK